MEAKKILAFGLLIIATMFALKSSVMAEEKPNIVVILADDLGYGDVRPNNPKSKIETPYFDQLAREGVNFVDAHSGSGVCTPTRYGLVCGRYCWRTSLKRGVLGGYSKPLIASKQQTIATVLKSAGYDTKCVGKWHLGLGWQWKKGEPDNINYFGIAGGKQMVDYSQPILDSPVHHGFQQCLIIPASLDMSPYVFIDGDRVTQLPNKVVDGRKFPAFYRKGEIASDFRHIDCLGHLTDNACKYIRSHKNSKAPFFLYFPMPAPHKPVIPSKQFQGTSGLGPYGDFVRQVDDSIGKIIKSIDESGMKDNTLLIVTSDNGSFMNRIDDDQSDHKSDESIQAFAPKNHTSNGDLRGTKADVWEGGHRVPFFVRWPSQIQGNRKITTTICLTDILASACDAGNVEFSKVASPDSFSFLSVAKGTPSKQPRPMVINHSAGGMFAIRDGKWKLVLGNGSGGREKPRGKPFAKPFELYDLEMDLGETNNVFDQHPDQVKKMLTQFEKIAPDESKQVNQ